MKEKWEVCTEDISGKEMYGVCRMNGDKKERYGGWHSNIAFAEVIADMLNEMEGKR